MHWRRKPGVLYEWLVPQGSRTKGVICSLTSSTEADRSAPEMGCLHMLTPQNQ
jgi:hypothetical protein